MGIAKQELGNERMRRPIGRAHGGVGNPATTRVVVGVRRRCPAFGHGRQLVCMIIRESRPPHDIRSGGVARLPLLLRQRNFIGEH